MASIQEKELRCIFNMFDMTGTGEIDVKQINRLLKNLDGLSVGGKDDPAAKGISPIDAEKVGSPTRPVQKKSSKETKDGKKGPFNSFPSNEDLKEADKEGTDAAPANPVPHVEIKSFPNRKTAMNFGEFCEVFNECIANKDIQDDILLSCFNVFDYESYITSLAEPKQSRKGYIDSKKIKDIFEVFKEKIPAEEIQNVLKFIGCNEDKMTFREFKEFFNKNL